jgi:hypothetical protein
VAALDASVRKGEKVAENDVVQVTELLMNELLKLDAVVADGDVKAHRRMQVNSNPACQHGAQLSSASIGLGWFLPRLECRGSSNLIESTRCR